MSNVAGRIQFSPGATKVMRTGQLCIMCLGGCLAIAVVVMGTWSLYQSFKDNAVDGPGFNSTCPTIAGFTIFYLALAWCQVFGGFSQSRKVNEMDGGTLLISFFCGCFCNLGIMIAWTVIFVREYNSFSTCGLYIQSHTFLKNAILVEMGFGWAYAGLPFLFFMCFCTLFCLGACCAARAMNDLEKATPATPTKAPPATPSPPSTPASPPARPAAKPQPVKPAAKPAANASDLGYKLPLRKPDGYVTEFFGTKKIPTWNDDPRPTETYNPEIPRFAGGDLPTNPEEMREWDKRQLARLAAFKAEGGSASLTASASAVSGSTAKSGSTRGSGSTAASRSGSASGSDAGSTAAESTAASS